MRANLAPQNARDLEGHDLPGLQTHGLACLGIAALSGPFPADHELSESAYKNVIFGGQGGFYDVNDRLNVLSGLKRGGGGIVHDAGDYFFFGDSHKNDPKYGWATQTTGP
jgi:hypothetical protein